MKVIDMHCDTITRLYHNNKQGLLVNDGHLDLKKMKAGDYLLQNFAMFTNLKNTSNPFLTVNQYINYYYQEIEKYPDYIKPVFSYQDIIDNMNNNVMSSLLTLEEGAVVDNDLSLLSHYYRLGVRMITLTWNYENRIGYPNVPMINTKDGLTPFGIEYIKEMERLGIIIDVSHLSDAGFYDVYNNTTKPFVASHSNARSICKANRNMSDDMILKLASRNGVIGINFYSAFLRDNDDGMSYLEDIVKHILYIRDLAGIDCIGLGSDFDGIDCSLELKDGSCYQMLKDALVKAGLSLEEIEKIFYKNVLRLYQELL